MMLIRLRRRKKNGRSVFSCTCLFCAALHTLSMRSSPQIWFAESESHEAAAGNYSGTFPSVLQGRDQHYGRRGLQQCNAELLRCIP
ncbi:hypothetical protein CEXT_776481 [Caerostris extrusa]|uniref:Secreted protein n=1 Tax=Caerostris extrusa TaxID=172846 RepID=A0AAV4P893_CAEEX|nr:hypothetical protein CEXT_776481 [Caerostris extrusa]